MVGVVIAALDSGLMVAAAFGAGRTGPRAAA
jgi:hypothetical protein